MEIEQRKISELNPAKYNPRVIDARAFAGLKETIKKFGLVQPIVINSDNTIIGGHQRVKACKELGINEVDCYIVDLDKRDEKMLNLLLNSAAITGNFDNDQLKEILLDFRGSLEYEDLLLADMEPIDFNELDKIDWDGMPNYVNENKLGKYQLIVNFDTLDAKLDFGVLISQRILEKTKSIWYPYKAKEVLKDKAYIDE